ncbi:MAG: restriction endonuclease subunit S [Tabrizicola sp.]|nr:restriction endonuclease subunit S [Tabrizicola sp.]
MNIRNGRLDLTDARTMPSEISDALPRSKLKAGDIVLGYVGSQLGNLAKIEEDNRFHLAPNVALIRPTTNVDSNYLLQYMQGPLYQSVLWSLASSTGQPALSMSNIRLSTIWLPPLPEQQKIAEILGTWDKAIETTEALLANTRTQKRALMQSLLTGTRRFPGFEDHPWREVRLGDVCEIRKGEQKSKSTLGSGGQFPVINGGVTPSGYSDDWNTEAGTITISEGGNSCGFANLIDVPFWSGGHCYTLENLRINRDYLFHWLKYQEAAIMRLRVGSGLPNIQKKAIASFPVSVPCAEEQSKIAAAISCIHDEETSIYDDLSHLRSEKKSLMQQLLTGKRRVAV